MIIRSIRIKEGLCSRFITFSDNVNLIHSEQNTKGKTTLLRFLLYSLGYNIPNTKRIKFERCEVETTIFSEKYGEAILSRFNSNSIIITSGSVRQTYVLPEQQHELHGLLFGTDNANVLDNLLGAFYVDQEKGWTLLNRGVAIGSIHFKIEELVRGLSGIDCSKLIRQEEKLSRELNKYRQMFSVAKYQETIEADSGSVAVDQYKDRLDADLEQLKIRGNRLKKELKRLDRAIKDNRQFAKFITEMKLLVKGPDGTTIPVTADNIVGFDDNNEYLIAKHKLISSELASVLSAITSHEDQLRTENEQMSFWESETMVQAFDRRIAALQINVVPIEKEIRKIENELKAVRQAITESTKANNSVVASLYRNMVKYAGELGVGNEETIAEKYLFTSNLRELSGAVLHKTVFAFRLAYIIEIERAIGVKLPLILDSPSGKEVDQENIKLMMDILKRDFSDHQIIIASIYMYDFNSLNVIEIVNRLIEIE